MSNPTISQSQKRFQESLASLFLPEGQKAGKKPCLFLKSSSDTGVMRNGGRNGARFAPQSFLSVIKKMSCPGMMNETSFFEKEVSDGDLEESDFASSQAQESFRIAQLLKEFPKSSLCHLGGGHDHVFPLLTALSSQYKKIVVLNIDAHADTRTDTAPHSGTPFRQFSEQFKGDFHLFQVGLHPFANSPSTLTPLTAHKMSVLWRHDMGDETKWKSFFSEMRTHVKEDTALVFSLDADALSAAEAPGVSAVNGFGISRETLVKLWQEYKAINFDKKTILGLYEMNPAYDGLAMTTVRTLATFVFETF